MAIVDQWVHDQRLREVTSVVDSVRRYGCATSSCVQTTRIATAQDLGKELATALGFEASNVRSIDFHVAVDDVVTAKVEVYVTGDQAATLRDIFAKRVIIESKVVGEKIVDE
jgi:hypothetical protein